MTGSDDRLSIVVVGASGDLASKKVIPALFALYCRSLLPESFQVFGYARSKLTDDEFRKKITEHLTCRYVPNESCDEKMAEFLARCVYVAGDYDSAESLRSLSGSIEKWEGGGRSNRMFYMAIPAFLLEGVTKSLGQVGLNGSGVDMQWTRAVIEKPFGKDRESSDMLAAQMAEVFDEDQIYRIDHYLGKEVIQNLMVLRFANLVFEPIWNREYIKKVQICWSEKLGVEGRGGYFDSYGIIRDVMQNHLLQMLAMVAMEPPITQDAKDIRDEKMKVLRTIEPVTLDDIVLGQYRATEREGFRHPSYVDEETVPGDSITPTYAAVSLRLQNRRWEGVPFVMSAGKGLGMHLTQIRIQFNNVPGNIFCRDGGCLEPNHLVIRVQPDEAIFLEIMNKMPGLEMKVKNTHLDLRYASVFDEDIPDAYESLLLDVIGGNKGLFIRSDELESAWDVFTPVLHEIDSGKVRPEPYEFGSMGPQRAQDLAKSCGWIGE